MSRPVKRDYDFDRNRIVNLFIKAKGGRSRAQFAQDAGVSLAFISAMTHDKFSEPPIPSTLKKIADSTKDVLYEELLDACGYSPERYISKNELEKNRREACASFGRLAYAAISSYLSNLPTSYSYEIPNDISGLYWDLIAKDANGNLWYFDYMLSCGNDNPSLATDILPLHLGRLLLTATDSTGKYTIVTDSPGVYNFFVDHKPTFLDANLSIMLINLSLTNLAVLKEETIAINHK